MSAAEKKALANAKPIYDAIVKYAKKAQAKNASGEPSSASGTSSPSLSGAKAGPARVSTGTQTSKSSTTSAGNHWW